eukprot:Em0003g356a
MKVTRNLKANMTSVRMTPVLLVMILWIVKAIAIWISWIQIWMGTQLMRQMGVKTPSLGAVKRFKLPGTKPTVRHVNKEGVPFYTIPLATSIEQFLGRSDIAEALLSSPYLTFLVMLIHLAVLQVDPSFSFPPTGFSDKADGKPVVMLPLVLFADDTSGNRSKKWHKFESWYFKLAGLPHGIGTKLENIHFVCSSDRVSALEMAEPIVEELIKLENDGIEVYDAYFNTVVLVIAPVICIVADNPMQPSSEHLGSLAWCFLASVAWAAAVADTPASNKVTGLSGEVMLTSNAAVLPKNQLGTMESLSQLACCLATSSNKAKTMVLTDLYGKLNLNFIR